MTAPTTPYAAELFTSAPFRPNHLDELQQFYTDTCGTGALLKRSARVKADILSGHAMAIVVREAGTIVAASVGYLHDNGTYEIGSVLVAPQAAGQGLYAYMRSRHLELAGDKTVLLFEKPPAHEIEKRKAEGFTVMQPLDPLNVMNMAQKCMQGFAAKKDKARVAFKHTVNGTLIAFHNDNDTCDRNACHTDPKPKP